MSRRIYKTRRYTSEDLIEILKQKAKELDRTPMRADLRQAETIVKRFGSWNKALEAAGIPIINRISNPYTKEELIKILQESAKVLKRTPKKAEIKQADTVARVFGSFSEGIIAAGLKPTRRSGNRKPYKSHKEISEQEIIKEIQKKALELGRTPKNFEVNIGSLAINKFGSWNKALKKASLEISKKNHTRSEILQLLQDYAKKNKRTPQQKDIPIHHGVYKRIFGSWNEALRAAGLIPYYKNNQELLEKLKRVSQELGKVPTVTECRQLNLSVATYQRRFGSWNKALEIAGLPIQKKAYTNEELLKILQDRARTLGRAPKCNEVKQSYTISRKFGSWQRALEEANLLIIKKYSYTKEELIEIVREKAKELNRAPKSNEVKQVNQIYKKFGNWQRVLEAAGLPVFRRVEYTKEELIEIIQKKAKELGRAPKCCEIKEINLLIKEYGSWNKALKAAGLPVFKKIVYTKEELIEIIQKKAKELNRAPKSNEIKQAPSIFRAFGSWSKALKAAGLLVFKNIEYTKEELIEIIQQKARELDRTPKSTEIKQVTLICRKFGSWNKALEAAGLPVFKKIGYTKEELIEIIQEKAKELERAPKSTEIKQVTSIYNKFKSWNKALEAAGLHTGN
ncbi:homing endonuclease associated repeat-containing protein [Bacillus cereus]|uniref:homing endonuclease associated repeat-containing protein n=1 Tax=Bacillus cereus TaxID=1396 RepID=UPI000BF305C5|nr:hypothetical protein [Bacillus cereus]PFJ23928.1 hypothetical protein COI92_26950 [Bacillus anthracis]PGW01276.1 hypothetical protein COD87_27695 [Bacillus cereus]